MIINENESGQIISWEAQIFSPCFVRYLTWFQDAGGPYRRDHLSHLMKA